MKSWKESVTIKAIVLFITVIIGIFLSMEILAYYYTKQYEVTTIQNYRSSFETYINYRDRTLESINHDLVSLLGTGSGDNNVWTICHSSDELVIQTNLQLLQRKLTSFAWGYGNEAQYFSFFPDKDIYIRSANSISSFDGQQMIERGIREYIDENHISNDNLWHYLVCQNEEAYLIKIYKLNDAYVGGILPAEFLIDQLLEDENPFLTAAELTDHETAFYELAAKTESRTDVRTIDFTIAMDNLPYLLVIHVLKKGIVSTNTTMLFLMVFTTAAGLLLTFLGVSYNIKNLVKPINQLKDAMTDFSRGVFDARVDEKDVKGEMQLLFRTYNHMTSEIKTLKVEAFERELSLEHMRGDFLRVQIQPHFYTNILNLIYGMAQVHDVDSIKQLAKVTGRYFRYLMGEKGTFVKLQEEIDCIRNYLMIQKIRYEESIAYEISVDESLDEQMVLPMMLQTFVGNSIKHNANVVDVLRVLVDISQVGDHILIRVEDNGAGFKAEILDKIKKRERISENEEHIGISNVMERMDLFYAGKANLDIESVPGKTVVLLTIPKVI